jgi:hypothetical protein
MSTQENDPTPTEDQQQDGTLEEQTGATDHDQDAEPSLNAPDDEAPTGE